MKVRLIDNYILILKDKMRTLASHIKSQLYADISITMYNGFQILNNQENLKSILNSLPTKTYCEPVLVAPLRPGHCFLPQPHLSPHLPCPKFQALV